MKKVSSAVVAVLLTLLSFSALAQPGDPGGGGNPTPITGIEFLIGSGVFLGLRRLLLVKKSSRK